MNQPQPSITAASASSDGIRLLGTKSSLPWVHQRQEGFLQEFTSPHSTQSFDDLDTVASYVVGVDA